MLNFNAPSQQLPDWLMQQLPPMGPTPPAAPTMPDWSAFTDPTQAAGPTPAAPTPAMPPTPGLPNLSAGAPVPPALPPLLERTDTNQLQSFGGDIHQRYQPLIDMALSTMMQGGGGPFAVHPGVAGHVFPALGAIGAGLAAGTGHTAQLGQMMDLADQQDQERSKRAVMAGQLLNELSSAESTNQEGLNRNVDAWSKYRSAEMEPRAQEFANLKDFNQGLAPLADATSTMDRLPDLQKLDASKVATDAQRRALLTAQTNDTTDLAAPKLTKAQQDASIATSNAAVAASKAANATDMAAASLKLKQAQAAIKAFQQSNPTIASGRGSGAGTMEYKTVTALTQQVDNIDKEYRMLESKMDSTVPPLNADAIQKRMDDLQGMRSGLVDNLDQAVKALPSIKNNMAGNSGSAGAGVSLKPKPTPAPTPFPDPTPLGGSPTLPPLDSSTSTAAPAPPAPPDPTQRKVGGVYSNNSGQTATWLGNGQWQLAQ